MKLCKKIFGIIVLVGLLLSFWGYSFAGKITHPTSIDNTKIAVLSDIHYYDASLGTTGNAFMQYLAGDRKMLAESDAILKSAVASIIASDADVVLIPGDLTKDGERINHEKVALYLKEIENAGKQVFVINGNHDINNPTAVKYEGDTVVPVDNISAKDFQKIYRKFGYEEAIERDPFSLSYVAQPAEGVWVLAMDSCIYKNNENQEHPTTDGEFSQRTFKWIKKQLEKARKKNITVIGMMHHGLVQHFEMQEQLLGEYLINDWRNISAQFADLGMKAVFTGHAHAQDAVSITTPMGNTLTDVETGSLLTYPSPYRFVEFTNEGNLNITSRNVMTIDYNTNGLPFPIYSQLFLAKGYETTIPFMFEQILTSMGWYTPEQVQLIILSFQNDPIDPMLGDVTMLDVLVNAMVNQHAGDEVLSPQVWYLIQQLRSSGEPSKFLLANVLEALSTDVTPKDNVLTVEM